MTLDVNQVLNDIWSLHLVFFGAGLAIFTLLYSFILSKRDDLKLLADQFKTGNENPTLVQRESFSIKYIQRLKKINDKVLILIVMTFSSFLAAWVGHRLVEDCELKRYMFYILSTLTVLMLILFFAIFYRVYKAYKFDTKV